MSDLSKCLPLKTLVIETRRRSFSPFTYIYIYPGIRSKKVETIPQAFLEEPYFLPFFFFPPMSFHFHFHFTFLCNGRFLLSFQAFHLMLLFFYFLFKYKHICAFQDCSIRYPHIILQSTTAQ